MPKAREVAVLLVDMLDDDEALRVLADAVATKSIEVFESAVEKLMDENGLDRSMFKLPDDDMSLQIPLDEKRVERLRSVHDLLFGAGGGVNIAETVFLMAASTPAEIVRLHRVCKLWREKLDTNYTWSRIAIRKWPFLANKRSIVRHWKQLVKARTLALSNGRRRATPTDIPIENCDLGLKFVGAKDTPEAKLPKGFQWKLKCPLTFSNIVKRRSLEEWCKVCKETVYVVKSEAELKQRVAKKQCVAIDFQDKIRRIPMPIAMGRVLRR